MPVLPPLSSRRQLAGSRLLIERESVQSVLSVQIISALAKFAEAGSVIQFLIAADASAFQFYQGKAYVSGLHGGDISRFVGKNGANNGSPSQIVLWAVAEVGRTAEQNVQALVRFARPFAVWCVLPVPWRPVGR